jgi:hypothetical protein
MLSADALATFNCTELPAITTAGVMVISTGSGPAVRFTVDVETPQPWRPSATHTSFGRGEKVLRVGRFIITAGVLIVREPARRSKNVLSVPNSRTPRMLLRCVQ